MEKSADLILGSGKYGRLNTYGDVLREPLGPARLSHPEEYNAILEHAKSALRHEYTHMLNDPAEGHPGLRIIADSEKFWEFEIRGYLQEINLARKIKILMQEVLFLMKCVQEDWRY